MPVFKPFRGIRPSGTCIDSFPTHPLSNFTHQQILDKAQQNLSYVKMVSPYLFDKSKDMQEDLRQVKENYQSLRQEKYLVQDELGYYLYSQTMPDGKVFRGLLGLVSVEDYKAGKIKKHEETLTHRKEKLAKYLEGVHLQAEPVLLTYSADSFLEEMMDSEEKNTPILDHWEGEVHYKIWAIHDKGKLQDLEQKLSRVDAFYIADGHHRMGSTALCAERKFQQNAHHTGEEAYNFVYSFIVSDQSIRINDFNKVVADLNGWTTEDFLNQLREKFLVEKKGSDIYYPKQKHHISMYLEGDFYDISLKEEFQCSDCMSAIDHYVLEKFVLKPILGIDNLKTSNRVDYQRGTSCVEGIKNLKQKVDSGKFKVGFGAYPVSFSDLVEIADKGLKMPPKCTYIEPKPITALVMYDMG